MTVEEIINSFNQIKDKSLDVEMVNPYKQSGKPISIDNICVMQIGNKICFDIETHGFIDF